MAFDDRLQFLLLGLAIGTVFGYLIRLLQDVKDRVQDVKEDVMDVKTDVQDVKEELDEVDTIVKRIEHHDEGGFVKPSLTAIAMLLIVGLTAFAALVSQQASNKAEAVVAKNEIISDCNNKILSEALDALNERSTYTVSQTQANVNLQTDFARFMNILLHQPPYDEETRLDAATKYQRSLNNFVEVAHKSTEILLEHQYPTENDLVNCIQNGK